MEFLPEEKQPKPYYKRRMRPVGTFNVVDGSLDITDPGYESDTWCAIFNKEVAPGQYHCFVDVVNFPYLYREEGRKKILRGNDERIMALTIVHENFINGLKNKRWLLLNNSIGVDAGMCGFYNHKPNFEKDEDWTNFCDNLRNLDDGHITCDLKPYGITVSSGFGDGCYSLYKKVYKKNIIALQLRFN